MSRGHGGTDYTDMLFAVADAEDGPAGGLPTADLPAEAVAFLLSRGWAHEVYGARLKLTPAGREQYDRERAGGFTL